jgi:NAD-specific glutamate dehydrogenase
VIHLGGHDDQRNGDTHLGLASRDHRVAGNQLGKDTTGGLNAEGKSGNINEDDILSAFLSRKDTTLDSSTIGNCLIGVYALGRISAAKEFLEKLLDLGYTCRTTDEYDLV